MAEGSSSHETLGTVGRCVIDASRVDQVRRFGLSTPSWDKASTPPTGKFGWGVRFSEDAEASELEGVRHSSNPLDLFARIRAIDEKIQVDIQRCGVFDVLEKLVSPACGGDEGCERPHGGFRLRDLLPPPADTQRGERKLDGLMGKPIWHRRAREAKVKMAPIVSTGRRSKSASGSFIFICHAIHKISLMIHAKRV